MDLMSPSFFRSSPTFLACMLCSVMAIMKSYPALGDAALPLALLALWAHIFPCKHVVFIVIHTFLYQMTPSYQMLDFTLPAYQSMIQASQSTFFHSFILHVDLRNTLLVMCMLICSSFLAPVFWQLWIYAGSANANFFFAITLAYSTAQVFTIS